MYLWCCSAMTGSIRRLRFVKASVITGELVDICRDPPGRSTKSGFPKKAHLQKHRLRYIHLDQLEGCDELSMQLHEMTPTRVA